MCLSGYTKLGFREKKQAKERNQTSSDKNEVTIKKHQTKHFIE